MEKNFELWRIISRVSPGVLTAPLQAYMKKKKNDHTMNLSTLYMYTNRRIELLLHLTEKLKMITKTGNIMKKKIGQ